MPTSPGQLNVFLSLMAVTKFYQTFTTKLAKLSLIAGVIK